MKEFTEFVFSDEWIQIAEVGSREQFKQELAQAVDPLTKKVLGITGDDFTQGMSYQMGNWIKDTTVLWIKYKGSGSTTTEFEIEQLRSKKVLEDKADTIKQQYEDKLKQQQRGFVEKAKKLG